MSFHPPTSDDPYWTETCWFTFTVPERRLSGQLYPFFRPNQRVAAGGAYFWDENGDQLVELSLREELLAPAARRTPLSDLTLANGIRYRCLEPLTRYELALRRPRRRRRVARRSRRSRPSARRTTSARATSTSPGATAARSCSQDETHRRRLVRLPRPLVGRALAVRHRRCTRARRRRTAATATPRRRERDAFHTITAGLRPRAASRSTATCSATASGRSSRRPARGGSSASRDGCPRRVRVTGARRRSAAALARRGPLPEPLGLHLNPNLFTVNCLTEWTFDGVTAFGEDHDNWSAAAFRRFVRGERWTASEGDGPRT